MTETLFQTLETALGIWEHHEKVKYLSEFVELRRGWNAEINKADSERDDSVLSDLSDQLRILAYAWSQAASQSTSGDKPGSASPSVPV